MTDELLAQYREAGKPFHGLGCFDANGDFPRPWRVFLEINSACNLSCVSCTKGNKAGYEHKNGYMDWDLMAKILDKIAIENPNATIFLYGNSEPFLHPKLPEVIVEVKKRGLRCELSTNLNFVRCLDELVATGPAFTIISVSGFTQEVYEKSHCGGDIEKVKANMALLSEANKRAKIPIDVSVSFHHYNDNGHEIEPMKAYCEQLGFGFFVTDARVISMENAIQYLREQEEEKTGQPIPFVVNNPALDLNKILPHTTQHFRDLVSRLNFSPAQAQDKYKDQPVHAVCPVGDLFQFVRHDGKTEMCACVADRRLTIGDFLTTSQEQLSERRRGHPLCQQCLKYRMSHYFHNVSA